MGLCCSNQQSQKIMYQDSARKAILYIDDAQFKRSEDGQTITFNFWDNETVKGIKNNGWTCDGELLLKGGCQKGFNQEFQTYDEQGFFDLSYQFALCKDCAIAALEPQNLIKWNAYFSEDGIKRVFVLDYFIIVRKIIRGAGTYNNVPITIHGSNDLSTGDITLYKLIQGEEREIAFRGKRDQDFNIIRTKHVDKFGTGPLINDSGWGCDGRHIFEKCFGGITDFNQTSQKINTIAKSMVLIFAWNALSTFTSFWVQGESKGDMTFERLIIAKNKVFGNGGDKIGVFIISGTINQPNGQVVFRKQYLGKHFVTYVGVLSNKGKTVKGDWKIEGDSVIEGTFELQCE
ncbi:UNKNOWN [Stylonychia lemnae]|uniref:Uncharacterized protein n=1 Tax=Stylonychia lemnae TaxID=5949 RepID=A0A078ANZ8_STYLE|nr:UNKNOWN [Stylonychia lemnae]|eukprot:CDW82683.1 UNKNOWN [Stylonychia lemnae]